MPPEALAFLLVTFVLAYLSLQMQNDADAVRSLLVAMNLAVALMVVEACGRQGLDNLLIPVGSVFLIPWLLVCSVPLLLFVLVCSLVVMLALSAIRGGRVSVPARLASRLLDVL